jgi:hypothetical protein
MNETRINFSHSLGDAYMFNNKRKQIIYWGSWVVVAVLLAACSKEVLPSGGNPIPTPIVGVDVGTAPDSQAAATPDDTYKRYINDSIAALVSSQKQKINMRQRYQNPDQTKLDLGGLVTEISILEDRTKIKEVNDKNANAVVDMDVRIKYADGDLQSFVCKYQVAMQSALNTKNVSVWYVINPDVFPVFLSCTRKP